MAYPLDDIGRVTQQAYAPVSPSMWGATMLAISTMSSEIQGIFFLISVAFFVLGALSILPGKKNLVAAGLAFFAFVFMWNAFAAS